MRGHLRKRGDAYELRAYAGADPVTGRQKYVTRTFRGSKREAEEALAKLVTEVSSGGFAAQDTTLADLLDRWLDLARPELSPTTLRTYEGNIRGYIKPTLGKVPLARLRPAQLDAFYKRLRDGGGVNGRPLAPATIRQVHAILRRSLNQAVKWGWITTNPATLASPPKVRKAQLAPPDPTQVVAILDATNKVDPEFGCFLLVAATTGARRGELCALRWSDIDLAGGSLTISRSVVEADGKILVEKDTKTHAARRIALDPGTIASLQGHKDRCSTRARSCGLTRIAESTFVFSRDADGERPWAPNDVTKRFIETRNGLGLNHVRLHDLRHFAATRMLDAGVPVRTVSGRLGHASASMTLGVYAHFLEASDREAAETLGSLLSDRKDPDG